MRQAVVFDLDGTLTIRNLDFDAIRAEIGLPPGPILEALEHLPPERRSAAEAVLYKHERHAAQTAELHTGAADTIRKLQLRGFAVGILTRNARPWAQLVLDRFAIRVDALRCREDGAIKPDPQGLLEICERFNAQPSASWMVGDYLFDIVAGKNAGLKTVLMIADGEPPDYADQADHVIRSLPEVLQLVETPKNT